MSKWIKVIDKAPEDKKLVLIMTDCADVSLARFDSQKNKWLTDSELTGESIETKENVTHWASLPYVKSEFENLINFLKEALTGEEYMTAAEEIGRLQELFEGLNQIEMIHNRIARMAREFFK